MWGGWWGQTVYSKSFPPFSVWEPCEEAWHSEGRWEWRMEVAKCPAHAFIPLAVRLGHSHLSLWE